MVVERVVVEGSVVIVDQVVIDVVGAVLYALVKLLSVNLLQLMRRLLDWILSMMRKHE